MAITPVNNNVNYLSHSKKSKSSNEISFGMKTPAYKAFRQEKANYGETFLQMLERKISCMRLFGGKTKIECDETFARIIATDKNGTYRSGRYITVGCADLKEIFDKTGQALFKNSKFRSGKTIVKRFRRGGGPKDCITTTKKPGVGTSIDLQPVYDHLK